MVVKPNSPAATATTKWIGISSSPASNPIGSLATISGGWRTVGIAVAASAKPAANNATARSLARTITRCATGNGPRIDESRGSSDSASQEATATSAITIIEQVRKNIRSSAASIAVRPGD
jgi:hypothetical protein